MPYGYRRTLFVALVLLTVCSILPSLEVHADSLAACRAIRQKAVELFYAGKRVEALPLLEEVVKANPKDDEMLVALADSLVAHAATLTDDTAAGKERLRARDLLQRAEELGNTSPLALNLSQFLRQLPPGGAITFSGNAQVEQRMRAGEAAFAQRHFDEALENYARALELEPDNYSAVLFTANTYDRESKFVEAERWYQRAIHLDPNVETAYRYYADMLAKEGDFAEARTMLIRAAVAEPYNQAVWRELHAWAEINDMRIHLVYIGVPAQLEEGQNPERKLSPIEGAAWRAYRTVKAKWQEEGEFKKRFPHEVAYRHTLAEESDALIAAAEVLEKGKRDESLSQSGSNEEVVTLLLKLYEAGLLKPYVLFSLGDSALAKDYDHYRNNHRLKLEEYLDRFVVPPYPR